jgi:type I restriction enzyme S subunit
MNEWKESTLKEIIDSANTGLDAIKRAPIVPEDTGIKCLRIQDISQGKEFKDWGFTNVEQRNYEKFRLRKGDIIIARTGNTIGVNRYFENDHTSVFNNGLIRLRVNKEKACPKYIYYNLRSKYFKDFIDSISGGTSTQPNMQIEVLLTLDINIAPLQEQERIAEVLSSLDDKIDLLHCNNKTLEQLAETLFRQWFVEDAEDSWEEVTLENIFDIGIGRTPPRKEQKWFSINPKDVKWVYIKDMGSKGVYTDTTTEYLTEEAIKEFNIPIIPQNTVILSFKMTIGRLGITTERMLSNEAIAHFKLLPNTSFYPEFLYLYLKTYRWEQLGSTSSIVESINSLMIKQLNITMPPEELLHKFKKTVEPYFQKIKLNQIQLKNLETLRESLLPKLMSGAVRVENI